MFSYVRQTRCVNSKSWLLRHQTSQKSFEHFQYDFISLAAVRSLPYCMYQRVPRRAPIKHSALQEIHPLYNTVLSWLLNKNYCRTFYLPQRLYLELRTLANSSLRDRSNGTDAGLFALRRPQPLANSSTITHRAPEPR